jgi:hypothetical protein
VAQICIVKDIFFHFTAAYSTPLLFPLTLVFTQKKNSISLFFYDLSFLIQSINLPFFFILAPGSSAGPNRVDVIRHTHTHARERKTGASFFVDEIPFLFVKRRKKDERQQPSVLV